MAATLPLCWRSEAGVDESHRCFKSSKNSTQVFCESIIQLSWCSSVDDNSVLTYVPATLGILAVGDPGIASKPGVIHKPVTTLPLIWDVQWPVSGDPTIVMDICLMNWNSWMTERWCLRLAKHGQSAVLEQGRRNSIACILESRNFEVRYSFTLHYMKKHQKAFSVTDLSTFTVSFKRAQGWF